MMGDKQMKTLKRIECIASAAWKWIMLAGLAVLGCIAFGEQVIKLLLRAS